ncbi:MAG: hypothetical protein ACE5HS_23610 [bacterium]
MKWFGLNLAFILLCILLNTSLKAQNEPIPSHVWQEAGLSYIQNFSPKDYNGGIQNLMVVQNKRGLMYFGNTSGVLIYDRVSWRLVRMPNRSTVRSLCMANDRIYVGAVGELGFLAPDATGQ